MQFSKMLIGLTFILISATSFSQKNVWTKLQKQEIKSSEDKRVIKPEEYQLFHFDYDLFISDFRTNTVNRSKNFILQIPMPNGETEAFSVIETSIFDEGLAKKYPGYTSFTGQGLETPQSILKLSLSPFGIHGMILNTEAGAIFIDPYTPESKNEYIVYYKSDLKKKTGTFTCGIAADAELPILINESKSHTSHDQNASARVGDCQLRTYRLALACTGEYSNFHGGTVEKVLAAYNASMTRVNGVYERDASITMKLIADTDKLIFLNASSDPYTNSNGAAMLSQNQTTIDNIIGFNNYDIGHVYSTGGGGIAQLRAPCSNSKAEGVTGSSVPVGDPFDIDYVAHEMGHQFGANHTQNNSCQRNSSTAVEPGSASTIMGYAGICNPNVQNNSDDHFHGVSMSEIANFIVAGNGNSCAVRTTLDNQKPEVTVASTSYIIPISTSFLLTATATDADGDILTYCWEQMDNEEGDMPPKANNTVGPAFRSLPPSTSPTRYFPDLQRRYNTWEVLPSVTRDMEFRCTVRDNKPLGGCTDETNVIVKTNASAGPFTVTNPNTSAVNWLVGTMQPVTWNVNNTDVAPINCSHVDILLSIDGGITYPYVLATKAPNVGTYEIETPNLPTTLAKVMVIGHENIFFDVSNTNFKISTSFTQVVDKDYFNICTETSISINIQLEKITTVTDPVTLTVENLPAEVSYAFGTNPLTVPGTTTLTISDVDKLSEGSYEIQIAASLGAEKLKNTITLFVGNVIGQSATLLTPPNYTQEVAPQNTIISWQTLDGSNEYQYEIATNPSFNTLVFSGTNIATSATLNLEPNQVYYWRVKGISPCTENLFSDTYSFKTEGGNPEKAIVLKNEVLVLDAGATANITNEKINIASINPEMSQIIITALPTQGVISLNNMPLEVGSIMTMADINNNVVTYQHNGSLSEDDIFNFDIIDDLGRWIANNRFTIKIRQANLGIAAFIEKGLLCFGDIDGIITAEGFGGTGPYTYSLDQINYVEEPRFEGLNDNEYNVYIKDANGVINVSNTIFLTQPKVIELNVSTDNYDINIEAIGGTGNILFSTDNMIYSPEKMLSDPGNGTYTIYAKDDNGCIVTQDISINIPALTGQANLLTDILCAGTNVLIEVNAMGGVTPYTFSYNNLNFQSNPNFNLPAGSYAFIVRDAGGKEIILDTLSTNMIDPITITLDRDRFVVVVNASGGVGDYLYSTDGFTYTTNDTITFTNNGTYKIYVKDGNDCVKTITLSLNVLSSVNTTIKQITCFGNNDGSIRLLAANGAFPFQYQLNDMEFSSVREWLNLPPGDYKYVVKDNSNDSIVGNIVIVEPDSLYLDIIIDSPNLTINPIGGTPPYQYSIDGGVVFLGNNVFDNLPNNTYEVVVKDKNGCLANSSALIVGSEDSQLLNDLALSPNPVKEVLIIASDILSFSDIQFSIFDINGKPVQIENIQKTKNNWTVDTSKLISGVYTITVKTKDQVLSKLFIKI